MIQQYSFGRMVIDGSPYDRDVIIFPNHVKANWWRAEGHRLQSEDMKDVIDAAPDEIIIGNGYSGVMVVDRSVADACGSKGIELVVLPSAEAVKRFNEETMSTRKKVIGLFHLTC